MAASIRQFKKGNISASGSGSATFDSATLPGSTIVVCFGDNNANVTVSDNKSNTYSQCGTDQTAGVITGQMWRKENAAGGATHQITLTAGSATLDCAFYCYELDGVAAASYDASASAQGNDAVTPFERASNALSQANNIVIALACSDGAIDDFIVASPFTMDGEEVNNNLYWADCSASMVTSSTSVVTPSFTIVGSAGAGFAIILGVFKEAAASGSPYTLTAAQGGYSLTGQAAGLQKSIALTAAQGSYALTGQNANLARAANNVLTAASGTYGILGSDAAVDIVMNAAPGSYTLTGQNANFPRGYALTAATGSYALGGQAAQLLWSGAPPPPAGGDPIIVLRRRRRRH